MFTRATLVKALLFNFSGLAVAASVSSAGRRDTAVAAPSPTSLVLPFKNAGNPFNFGRVDFSGDGQTIYVANITVDGLSYEVQLDTGSSDLWLNTNGITLSPLALDTNISTTLRYGDNTTASGDVFIAPVQFGEFSIPAQAFLNAPGSNATSDNDLGLMGISCARISRIYQSLVNSTWNGLPVLYNIFSAYPTVSNYMTFQLSRGNLGITDGGIFTLGEVDSNMTDILDQPRLPVIDVLKQWLTVVDAFIVNGEQITGHGILASGSIPDAGELGASLTALNSSKVLALIDSGTSTGALNQHYWDAIYKNVSGLTLHDNIGLYTLPCDTKVNVSVIFAGQEYPINPLDLTMLVSLPSNLTTLQGPLTTYCIPSLSAADFSAEGEDMILGDAFMRNVYALFNFGSWTKVGAMDPPYMQLKSVTNQAQAWADFDAANQARVQQWNQLGGMFNTTSA